MPIPICFSVYPKSSLRKLVPIIKYIILIDVLWIVLLTSSSSLNYKKALYFAGINILWAIANTENITHETNIGIKSLK